MESSKAFVAINFISCRPEYRERFEQLFATRARAIDRMPGFGDMQVLRPQQEGESYLIVSRWKDEGSFRTWTNSAEFLEGHKRGFEDVKHAKQAGQEPPMSSTFHTYHVIAE